MWPVTEASAPAAGVGAAGPASGAHGVVAAVMSALAPAARARADELRADPVDLSDGDRIFQDAVADIRVGALQLRADELQRQIDIARGEDQERLLREKTEVTRQLKALGYDTAHLGMKVSPRHRRHGRSPDPERRGPTTPER